MILPELSLQDTQFPYNKHYHKSKYTEKITEFIKYPYTAATPTEGRTPTWQVFAVIDPLFRVPSPPEIEENELDWIEQEAMPVPQILHP